MKPQTGQKPDHDGRPIPTQTEGPDEEAGEGLEQTARQPDAGTAPPTGPADACKHDKGGIVH